MTSTDKASNYRPDIDGLRAVAVLSVMAYHVPIYAFHGGFVGVDVFFVISGYLITSRIATDLARSEFSLASFYERRVRRIFPALLATLGGASLIAWRCLMPTEFEQFARSLVAAALSLSNVLFWTEAGYFDAPSTAKPLLHTWSLAIEEQFYVVFPLFLAWLSRRAPKRLRGVLFGITLASLAMSVAGQFKYQTATFYLAHTRAWELLVGSLVALKLVPKISGPVARNVATGLGLAAILLPVFVYTDATPFPGIGALPPCFGAALIILAGESGPSFVGRVLSLRPVVFVGLISYSLYLWHWPVIVFQNHFPSLVGSSAVRLKLEVIAASFALAIVSYELVESPFRSGALKGMSRAALFRTSAAAAAALCLFGVVTIKRDGYPSRFPPEAVSVAAYMRLALDGDRCFVMPGQSFDDQARAVCLHADPKKKNYLLIGDSHAAHLWYGLDATFKDVNVMHVTASGCKPTSGEHDPGLPECRAMMNYVYHDYLKKNSVDALWIAGRWDTTDLPRLAQTASWAREKGVHLVVLGPVPQYDVPLPRLLASAIIDHDPDLPRHHRLSKFVSLDAQMLEAAKDSWGVKYVSILSALCRNETCVEYAAPGVPLQMDYGHFTKGGSLYVARELLADLTQN